MAEISDAKVHVHTARAADSALCATGASHYCKRWQAGTLRLFLELRYLKLMIQLLDLTRVAVDPT